MTKATAGERFAAKWAGPPFSSRMASELDAILTRERAKVAEDVLAMVKSEDRYLHAVIVDRVRAKYGKGKR